uniref:Uncharacterized protein n=1 Tax=Setaria digitata TaxID=48799 RepID=A0A915Q5R0_9BILA
MEALCALLIGTLSLLRHSPISLALPHTRTDRQTGTRTDTDTNMQYHMVAMVETRRVRRLIDGSGSLSSTNISTCTRVSFDQPILPTVQTGSTGSSAFNRLAAIGDTALQKTNTLRQRRTSLPVSPNAFAASRAALQSNLTEARGLVAEMLANKDLPPTVISGLKAVASLLNPQPPSINLHFDFGLPMVVENPYSGERLVVSALTRALFPYRTNQEITSLLHVALIIHQITGA